MPLRGNAQSRVLNVFSTVGLYKWLIFSQHYSISITQSSLNVCTIIDTDFVATDLRGQQSSALDLTAAVWFYMAHFGFRNPLRR